jgi:hypothetical protein
MLMASLKVTPVYGFDGALACVIFALLTVLYVTAIAGIVLYFHRRQSP